MITDKCNVCGASLDQREIDCYMEVKLPPVCNIHLEELQKKKKKCLPLIQKINFS